MSVELPMLALGLVFALVIAGVLWIMSASRTGDKDREERRTRHIAQQPWDAQSADGRGNR